MQDHELKIQHLIILSALFVTLLGSLLLLDKINETTQLTGSTTIKSVDDIDEHTEQEAEQNEDDSVIRVVTTANLSDS